MWKLLSILQKKMTFTIPLFMILGLLYGYFFSVTFLKSWIQPLTFLMVYPMMVTMNMKELIKKGNQTVQFAALFINFTVMPFIGFTIGRIFFPNNTMLVLGLLLASLIPTSGMTISWTGFAKGNLSAAIKMTIIGLISGSLLTPIYLKVLMGASVAISLPSIFLQIITVVFLPMIVGYATQLILRKKYGDEQYQTRFKPKFPLFSTVGVFGIVFVSMALKSKNILSNPGELLYILIPLLIFYMINFLISTIVAKFFFDRANGIALVYGTVMRNLSIALAIALSVFKENGSEIALIIALAYIIQVQSAAWYVKFTDIIFKK
jgi:ACR3 family arsenite transporter